MLHVGDRVVLELANTGQHQRYGAAFDVGLTGAVCLLNDSEPDGLTLEPGARYEIGRDWTPEGGLELAWIEGLPAGRPRPECFVVVIADAPVDGLRHLGQPGATRGRGSTDPLARLAADVTDGRRDAVRRTGRTVRHRVHRVAVLFHPDPRP